MAKHPLIVLISGSGTNLQALIDACAGSSLDADIVRVISNRKAAKGLERAARAGIATSYHNLKKYKDEDAKENGGELDVDRARSKYDSDLAQLLLQNKPPPEVVVCAGFMHILKPTFLDPLKEAGVKVINLHPALPGEYPGVDAIERAHADFLVGKRTYTGLMIHYVIAEVDEGDEIVVHQVDFKDGESQEDLFTRFHAQEHIAIVEGTKLALEAFPGDAPKASRTTKAI